MVFVVETRHLNIRRDIACRQGRAKKSSEEAVTRQSQSKSSTETVRKSGKAESPHVGMTWRGIRPLDILQNSIRSANLRDWQKMKPTIDKKQTVDILFNVK
ncbi:hypothetical protein TNCV_238391 [Trichonephila clavipes]|nr:hypothetical protein TNCV_238391 [Trichonephila clavipes]